MSTTIRISQGTTRPASQSDSITDDEDFSSGSQDHSDSLLDGETWDQVYTEEIEPSDSASRPPTSRRREVPAPSRPVRRHTTSEQHRAPPVRRGVPHPQSTIDSDDYPYPGYGRGYPAQPQPGYGGAPRPGYAQSAFSGPPGYAPPFGGALTHYGAPQGGFPQYPQQNPFSPQPAPGPGGAGYFNGGGHPQMPAHGAPPYVGHEMMPAYQPMPGYGYPGYPPPPSMSPHMQYYPPQWGQQPPSDSSATGDPETERKLAQLTAALEAQKLSWDNAKKELEARDKAEADKKRADEIAAEAAKKSAEEKAAWEKKLELEKKEAQAKGEEAAKKRIEGEKKKAEEKAAEEKEKADQKAALEKAEKDAKEAVAKAEKALKEAVEKTEKEAKEKVAKAEKDAEEAVKKAKAPIDDKKKPIRFKDAVGRKFSFPFHLCATWAGMEELIKQAFQHVNQLGHHVAEGRYDLIGPNGEIILPQVWETMIEPDWSVTMHMWPLPEARIPPMPPGAGPGGRPPSRHGGRSPGGAPGGFARPGPPPPAGFRPPGHPGPGPGPGPAGRGGPGPSIITVDPRPQRRKTEPKSMLGGFFSGRPAKSSKTSKRSSRTFG